MKKDFYLSFARVDTFKRVDRIVRAFQNMPDKKLIIASGGVELENIKKLAANAPNIKTLGWVDEKTLTNLIKTCIATIYVPQDEDFGMTAVESLAAGKPVVTCAEGGCLETISHGETGYICCPDPSADEISQAVQFLTPERCLKMQKACQKAAEKFSEEKFIAGMRKIIESQP